MLCCRQVAEGLDPDATPVSAVMTARPESCGSDVPLVEALRIMQRRRYQHLPVLEERAVGITVAIAAAAAVAGAAGDEGGPPPPLQQQQQQQRPQRTAWVCVGMVDLMQLLRATMGEEDGADGWRSFWRQTMEVELHPGSDDAEAAQGPPAAAAAAGMGGGGEASAAPSATASARPSPRGHHYRLGSSSGGNDVVNDVVKGKWKCGKAIGAG